MDLWNVAVPACTFHLVAPLAVVRTQAKKLSTNLTSAWQQLEASPESNPSTSTSPHMGKASMQFAVDKDKARPSYKNADSQKQWYGLRRIAG